MNAKTVTKECALRVVFSKAEPGADYVEVARGTWMLGRDPVLSGEPIPPEVLTGLEVQARSNNRPTGTLTHDRADVRYAMDFEAMNTL